MADTKEYLFDDARDPEARRALAAWLAEHPEEAEDVRRWEALREAVRTRLARDVPDRELLVLHALDERLLDDDERARLQAARADLDAARRAHPALDDVLQRIRREADDFDALWDEHFAPEPRRAASGRTDRAPARPKRRMPRGLWRAGAAFAVVAFVAIALLLVQRDAGLVVVEAPAGTTRLVELADGSTVHLQGGAVLTYPEAAARDVVPRRTRLTGRAFFDVAPGEAAFIVETPTARATVLGTAFGITAEERLTEVVLATGRLALAPRGLDERTVVLAPGQMSRVAEGALPSTPAAVPLDEALAWTDWFFFERTPVPEIADRLAAHYEVPVAVAPALREERVTGTFEKRRGLEAILRVVAATLGAEVDRLEEGGYLLRPAASGV